MTMEPEKNPGARGKIKKEQGGRKYEKRSKEKSEKGARGKKMKGVGSKREVCERSKEHGPP